MNRAPRWVPTNEDGTNWVFLSYRGKYLGCIIKVDDSFLAEKFCCSKTVDSKYIFQASGFVETTLGCNDCICRVSASN